jgi:simple sugar transport system permease protein
MSSPATTPATQPQKTSDAPAPVKKSLSARVLTRPEIGAVAAAIAIFIFFFAIAPPFRTLPSFSTVLYASSTIGIVAVGVALLMIGGEFDLSSGVTVVTAALCAALVTFQLSLNMWVGVLVSLLVALGIGFINGYLVVKTKIPSFLITLSTFFMLRGINLGVTKAATGTVATDNVSGLDGFLAAKAVFASDIPLGFITVKVTVLWWLLFVAIGTWILLRTKVGNWIFAAGGDANAARNVGVAVAKVKIGLFMCAAMSAALFACVQTLGAGSADVLRGTQKEFEAIIAAVIGGCLLTGGYGSVIGAAIGAFIFGMTNQGIVYAGWNPDWFYFFLGALLLGAILFNNFIRQRAEAAR